MDTETDALQHPDFVWTWVASGRGRRQSLWLPYMQRIECVGGKQHWLLHYQGGQYAADLAGIDSIMLYGATGDIPVSFLDALNTHRICLSIHRRNQPSPYIFMPAGGADQDDLLTRQLTARANESKSAYVARTLIRERLHEMASTVSISATTFRELASCRSVEQTRLIEAHQTARFWDVYFAKLGVLAPERRRECMHPVNAALDACSFFLHGILLRWVLFHRLSPFHGYLHRPTGYPALVFDLLEPYRHWIEAAVADATVLVGPDRLDNLTAVALAQLKNRLEAQVYIPATRQTVRRKSLLHGVVLSLRAWLCDEQVRLVLPTEGERKGGRPPVVGYKLPGYQIK